jgi:3-hydroxyisobutyrate dehydrogenase-like beta-hydroxyacid dehydrogenase
MAPSHSSSPAPTRKAKLRDRKTTEGRAARPILEAMAQTVYHLGEEVGTGAAFKMVNQLLAGVHIAAACEALAFAKRLGLDLAQVYEVISHAPGSSWMRVRTHRLPKRVRAG